MAKKFDFDIEAHYHGTQAVQGMQATVAAAKATADAAGKVESSFDKASAAATAFGKEVKDAFKSAMGGGILGELAKGAGDYDKRLYDLSRTAKVTGQSFAEMQRSIESVTEKTKLSRNQAADFFSKVSDGTRGMKMSAEQTAKLAEVLSSEFGPALEDVTQAFQKLSSLQQKDIFLLRRLDELRDPKKLGVYAANMALVKGATEQEINALFKTARAYETKGRERSKEEKSLLQYQESLQGLKKTFENLRINLGKPLADIFSRLAPEIEKVGNWLDRITKNKNFGTIMKIAGTTAAVGTGLKLATGAAGMMGAAGGMFGGGLGSRVKPAHVIVDNLMGRMGGGGLAAAAGGVMRGGMMGGAMIFGGRMLGGRMRDAGEAEGDENKRRRGAGISAASTIGGGAVAGGMAGASIGTLFGGPIGTAIGGALGALAGGVGGAVASLKDLTIALGASPKSVERLKESLERLGGKVMDVAKRVFGNMIDRMVPMLEKFADMLGNALEMLIPVFETLADVLINVVEGLGNLLESLPSGAVGAGAGALTGLALGGPIGALIGGVAGGVLGSGTDSGSGARSPKSREEEKANRAAEKARRESEKAQMEALKKQSESVAGTGVGDAAFLGKFGLNKAVQGQLRKGGMSEKEVEQETEFATSGAASQKWIGAAMKIEPAEVRKNAEEIKIALKGAVEDVGLKHLEEDLESFKKKAEAISFINLAKQTEDLSASFTKITDHFKQVSDYAINFEGNLGKASQAIDNQKKLVAENLKLMEKQLSRARNLAEEHGGSQGVQEKINALFAKGTDLTAKESEQLLTLRSTQELLTNGEGRILELKKAIISVEMQRVEMHNNEIAVSDAEVGLMEQQLSLVKAQYLGLGPTLDMQLQIVDALDQQNETLKTQLAKAQAIYAQEMKEGKDVTSVRLRILQIEGKLTANKQKQVDVSKNLREGYLDALQAFTNVEGAFGKIILSKDLGAAEMMRQFGSPGGTKVGKVGAGSEEASMRWGQGGSLSFDSNYRKTARGFDANIDRPEELRLNRAAAEQDSKSGEYMRQRDVSRQTGMPETGQRTRGKTSDQIAREVRGGKFSDTAALSAAADKAIPRSGIGLGGGAAPIGGMSGDCCSWLKSLNDNMAKYVQDGFSAALKGTDLPGKIKEGTKEATQEATSKKDKATQEAKTREQVQQQTEEGKKSVGEEAEADAAAGKGGKEGAAAAIKRNQEEKESEAQEKVDKWVKYLNDTKGFMKGYESNTTIGGGGGMAEGGAVPGWGSGDTVPAMLTPGEFVMNKGSSQKYGGLLRAINSGGKVPGFADGGEVDKTYTDVIVGTGGAAAEKVQEAVVAVGNKLLDVAEAIPIDKIAKGIGEGLEKVGEKVGNVVDAVVEDIASSDTARGVKLALGGGTAMEQQYQKTKRMGPDISGDFWAQRKAEEAEAAKSPEQKRQDQNQRIAERLAAAGTPAMSAGDRAGIGRAYGVADPDDYTGPSAALARLQKQDTSEKLTPATPKAASGGTQLQRAMRDIETSRSLEGASAKAKTKGMQYGASGREAEAEEEASKGRQAGVSEAIKRAGKAKDELAGVLERSVKRQREHDDREWEIKGKIEKLSKQSIHSHLGRSIPALEEARKKILEENNKEIKFHHSQLAKQAAIGEEITKLQEQHEGATKEVAAAQAEVVRFKDAEKDAGQAVKSVEEGKVSLQKQKEAKTAALQQAAEGGDMYAQHQLANAEQVEALARLGGKGSRVSADGAELSEWKAPETAKEKSARAAAANEKIKAAIGADAEKRELGTETYRTGGKSKMVLDEATNRAYQESGDVSGTGTMSAESKAYFASKSDAPKGRRAAAAEAASKKEAAANKAAADLPAKQAAAWAKKDADAKAKSKSWYEREFGGGSSKAVGAGGKGEREAEKQTRASEKTAAATQQTAKATTETNKAIDKGTKSVAASAGQQAEKDYKTNPVVSQICGNLGMASGGSVPGMGSGDTVPAMLTPGEFVMKKGVAQQHAGLLEAMNSNRFATGGIVPPAGMGGGGGGGGPNISLNVRGDSVNSIMKSVAAQLGSTLTKMMSPSGTGGRYFDLSQSG